MKKTVLLHKWSKRTACLVLLVGFATSSGICQAGQQLPVPGFYGNMNYIPASTQLPVLSNPNIDIEGVAGINTDAEAGKMTIDQTKQNVIIDWESFNIGSKASVHFDQKGNTSWSALNRIYDANPTKIYGQLSADGTIYLINRNGILFGPGSQVNVHSLVASTLDLDIDDEDFYLGNYPLTFNNDDGLSDESTIANYGDIRTGYRGSAWFIAPNVINGGAGTLDSETLKTLIAQGVLTSGHALRRNRDDVETLELLLDKAKGIDAVLDAVSVQKLQEQLELCRLIDNGMAFLIDNDLADAGYEYPETEAQIEALVETVTAALDGADESLKASSGYADLAALGAMLGGDTYQVVLPGTWKTLVDDATAVMVENDVILPHYQSKVYSPGGKIYLLGGAEVTIDSAASYDEDASVFAGSIHNYQDALLATETGTVTLHAGNIQQDGIIRSVTALNQNGKIVLKATDSIMTGADSLTESPIIESTEEGTGEIFQGGLIELDARVIDHHGTLRAHSGIISVNSSERTLLNDGSLIDVSGVWASRSGDANEMEIQLNSVQMRDEHEQKGGSLPGKTVTFNALLGSELGDVSGELSTEMKTALETATSGGEVTLSSDGEIVGLEGAEIDISGGGIYYDDGQLMTTQVYTGKQITSYSSASGSQQIDGVATSQTFNHEKFGVEETYTGLYYGGIMPLYDYVGSYHQGSDAGKLMMYAPTIVFNGSLLAGASNSIYQTQLEELSYLYDSSGEKKISRGLAMASAGILEIGDSIQTDKNDISEYDYIVETIDVVQQTADPSGLTADPVDSPLADDFRGTARISAELLNNSGLQEINLYANNKVKVAENVALNLKTGGQFSALGGGIEQLGEITVPGGVIELTSADNYASLSPDEEYGLEQKVFLGANSLLSVSGEQVDNAYADSGDQFDTEPTHLDGGVIRLSNESNADQGIVLTAGSRLETDGGYYIERDGDVIGGAAGDIEIEAKSIVLGGELSGLALPGKDGGSLTLHAQQVVVTTEPTEEFDEDLAYIDAIPEVADEVLTLNHERLAETGFGQINLKSVDDLTVEDGVKLAPSFHKMVNPTPGAGKFGIQVAGAVSSALSEQDSIVVDERLVGSTAITLQAGASLSNSQSVNSEQIVIPETAVIAVTPEGKVGIKAPSVDFAGTIWAPAGDVSLTATYQDLTLHSGSSIFAGGYNRTELTSLSPELPLQMTPLAGGSISLAASNSRVGNLVVQDGVLIDVSAAQPATAYLLGTNGMAGYAVAADAGSLSLTYGDELVFEGDVNAAASSASYSGGQLSLNKNNFDDSMSLSEVDLATYLAQGFSSLELISKHSIDFQGSIDATFKQGLTIDAPQLVVANDQSVRLAAPWVQWLNNYNKPLNDPQLGTGQLSLVGDWVDVEGVLSVSGVEHLLLQAKNGISLSDHRYYKDSDSNNAYISGWYGGLESPGSLTLSAGNVFPTTDAQFILQAADTLTIARPSDSVSTMALSAGGHLHLEAPRIIQSGTLSAPMGTISLYATDRLYLSSDSLTSVRGEIDIAYGYLDNNFWQKTNKDSTSDPDLEVSEQPESGIYINDRLVAEVGGSQEVQAIADEDIDDLTSGTEVIAMAGASIDISGGGAIYAFESLPGTEGSVYPFDSTYFPDRYVIVPGLSTAGAVIQLDGSSPLPAGTYSILPAEFAFLPGAYVVEATGQKTSRTPDYGISDDGYEVAYGQLLQPGESKEPLEEVFVVRSAADVLLEGAFNYESINAGNAADLGIVGDTIVFDSSLSALPEFGYQGGSLTFSAKNSAVVTNAESLDPSFNASEDLPAEVIGNSMVLGSNISGQGLADITIGQQGKTKSIRVVEGSTLEADNLTFVADHEISVGIEDEQDGNGVIDQETYLTASGEGGTVHFINSESSLPEEEKDLYQGVSIGPKSVVRSAARTILETDRLDLRGDVKLTGENGYLGLKADTFYLVADTYDTGSSPPGVYLTESLKKIEGVKHLELTAESEIAFYDEIVFASGLQSLILDSPQIVSKEDAAGGSVGLLADQVLLKNSGGAGNESLDDTGVLSITASESLTVGPGGVLLDGYSDIDLQTQGNLTFVGESSLKAGYDDAAGGNMQITAAKVTTAMDAEQNNANALLDASGRKLVINNSGAEGEENQSVKGILQIDSESLDLQGVIEVAAGDVTFNASGTDGVSLGENAVVDVAGRQVVGQDFVATYSGGNVYVNTPQGKIDLAGGSIIDVSAAAEGADGDAGIIRLDAPQGDVDLNGTLAGHSTNGRKGSFVLNSGNGQNLDSLNAKLKDGGFGDLLSIETRDGDLSLSDGETIEGRIVQLAADAGTVDIAGDIIAKDGANGGEIELWGQNVELARSATLDASGEQGGDVTLGSAEDGAITTKEGSLIDVSGASDELGGSVYYRVARGSASDISGQVEGAKTFKSGGETVRDIFVEQYKVFNPGELGNLKDDAEAFAPDTSVISVTDTDGNELEAQYLVGQEVRSDGDLILDAFLDINSWVGDYEGVLTLRTAGDLSINKDLVINPNHFNLFGRQYGPTADSARDSWAINLVAGADAGAANILRTTTGTGVLRVADDVVVYSESAPIILAAGSAIELGTARKTGFLGFTMGANTQNDMPFSVGTFDSDISVYSGGNLNLSDSAIQSAVGDVSVSILGDLLLGEQGAIRTTGTGDTAIPGPGRIITYWNYHSGGDVAVDVAGDIASSLVDAEGNPLGSADWEMIIDATDGNTYFLADYLAGTTGLITMGGGNVRVRSGGDLIAQVGALGLNDPGSVSISAGGDVDGRFAVRDGEGIIMSGGKVGTRFAGQTLEAFATDYQVTAQGDISLGTILNPTLAHMDAEGSSITYTEQTAASLYSLNGSVALAGTSAYYPENNYKTLLPPTLDIRAAENISLLSSGFLMAPAEEGNLTLIAGQNISGKVDGINVGAIRMSDASVADIYDNWSGSFTSLNDSLDSRIHREDKESVVVKAGNNIETLRLYLPKKADISAGNDITNLHLLALNANESGNDLTKVRAGNNLTFEPTTDSSTEDGLFVGGEGVFAIIAGNNLNLGSSQGIKAIDKSYLNEEGIEMPERGSDLLVLVGADKEDVTVEDVEAFFDELRAAGIAYTPYIQSDPEKAFDIINQARAETIEPFFAGTELGEGKINMIQSAIVADASGSDLYIITAGDIEVGQSAFSSGEQTDRKKLGIIADGGGYIPDGGGDVNIFIKEGSLEVLESRVVAKFGGDITTWIDKGDLNAGRGSATALGPALFDPDSGLYEAPTVGSGIRTASYDPDAGGPAVDPGPGDGYFFTPEGVIDAGEGGISVSRGYFGASEVLNSQNISISVSAVGGFSSGGVSGIGSVGGTSGVSEVSKITEDSSALGDRALADAAALVDDFMAKWVEAKVIAYPDEF